MFNRRNVLSLLFGGATASVATKIMPTVQLGEHEGLRSELVTAPEAYEHTKVVGSIIVLAEDARRYNLIKIISANNELHNRLFAKQVVIADD